MINKKIIFALLGVFIVIGAVAGVFGSNFIIHDQKNNHYNHDIAYCVNDGNCINNNCIYQHKNKTTKQKTMANYNHESNHNNNHATKHNSQLKSYNNDNTEKQNNQAKIHNTKHRSKNTHH